MTIFAGIAEFEYDLIRGVLARDAERPRSEASNWEDPERLLWIRLNWHRLKIGSTVPP
jgi:hypothetical protein